jgi:hypothetical protein
LQSYQNNEEKPMNTPISDNRGACGGRFSAGTTPATPAERIAEILALPLTDAEKAALLRLLLAGT